MMKINKLMPFLVGAVAFSVATVPLIVKADAIHKGFPLIAQGEQTPYKKGGNWANLNLTDTQKQQLRDIKQETRSLIEKVYTPDQLAKLEAAKSQRQQGQRTNRRELMQSLNLNEDQKARIKQIREAQKAKMDSVFTADQKRQLEQQRAQWQQKRQQRQQQQQQNQ
ncbi:hypothetical protein NIES4071_84940 [Calothrix sp. NIES-4071]|nr:hypothetical protein NIES4071_84940 [Calothrix sp. NIES-4071]BAZ62761.1 hypothetical protein NIES4105_84870 [Calothrix sp. NIES-4105]